MQEAVFNSFVRLLKCSIILNGNTDDTDVYDLH